MKRAPMRYKKNTIKFRNEYYSSLLLATTCLNLLFFLYELQTINIAFCRSFHETRRLAIKNFVVSFFFCKTQPKSKNSKRKVNTLTADSVGDSYFK